MDRLAHSIHELAHRREFFRRAFHMLQFNGISGAYAEFGCASARTARMAIAESRAHDFPCDIWCFDSFAGLPDAADDRDCHPQWVPGSMKETVESFRALLRQDKIDCSSVRIVPGFYEKTLADPRGGTADLPDDIALAWVDCDMYSSSDIVFRFLEGRLKHGMVIAIDDYYCYSAKTVSGERLAFLELTQRAQGFHFLPYVQIGWHGMSFVVEDRAIADALPPGVSY